MDAKNRVFGLLLGLVLASQSTLFADGKLDFPDGMVNDREYRELTGKDATILLKSGLKVDGKFSRFLNDRRTQSIAFVEYQTGQRSVRKPIAEIYRIQIGASSLALDFLRRRKRLL